MKRFLSLALPLSLCLAAPRAHAQDDELRAPWVRLAHVSISAPAGIERMAVLSQGNVVAECSNYCDFWAPPGRYTFYASDGGSDRTKLSLRIKDNARLAYQEEDETMRSAGMVLGLFGSLSTVVGLVVLFANADVGGDSPMPQSTSRSAEAAGGLMALGGAIATPIGFVMFSHGRAKLTPVAADEAKSTPHLQLGFVGVSGGIGLGGGAVF